MPEESVARLSNPSDSISPGSKSQAPPQKKNNFPVAVTVGGGIAALLVIAAAIVGALLIMRQRKRNKQRAGGRSLAKGTRKLAPENRGVDYQQGTNATQSWPSVRFLLLCECCRFAQAVLLTWSAVLCLFTCSQNQSQPMLQ